MDKILTLLDLHKQASLAPDLKSFEFITLNKSNQLVSYNQAVFWNKTDFDITFSDVSGNITLDKHGSYAQWLKSFIKKFGLPAFKGNPEKNALLFSRNTIDARQKAEWEEHTAQNCALIAFKNPEGTIVGGLWIERNDAFNDGDIALLEELSLLYSQTYNFLKLRRKASLTSPWKKIKKHQKLAIAACVILALLPVRLSITAPAEIVTKNPTVVTVPYDGVLDKILVTPGDKVTQDQVLFTMDMTELDGKIESTRQALQTAEKQLSRLRRESLSIPEKKVEISQLIADISARKIDYEYAQRILEKSTVSSTQNGIAIFSDADDFDGQPVNTGEKIMVIADPNQVELLIKIPVNNMIPIDQDSPTKFFLNVSPLHGYEAEIISMGYQAGIDTDGLLTYKVRAKILNNAAVRIGWKGSAKIKGEWGVLIYSVLRRPLITLRQMTGI
ncbi:MAG: efflux RND transporter periplasmic adaptor subunit [Bdellovibrionales bacterium]